MIITSSCLAGKKCRYNGEAKPCQKIIDLVAAGQAIPVCPEELGGLPTPRPPAEQVQTDKGERVLQPSGSDVTEAFQKGAQIALETAKKHNIKKAVLKKYSPSCGVGEIYDGTFSGKLIKGSGVTARLLAENGIECVTEDGEF